MTDQELEEKTKIVQELILEISIEMEERMRRFVLDRQKLRRQKIKLSTIEWQQLKLSKGLWIILTPQEIRTIKTIEEIYWYSFEDIKKYNNRKEITQVRRMLVKSLKDTNWLTLERIWLILWGRNHTSIYYLYNS